MPVRYYNRYDENVNYDGFDHIIIGSGIAALSLAGCLAEFGQTSLILEKHHKPGGFTHSFKRKKGYQWDVGVHYVGGLAENRRANKIFKFLSDGELEWEYMGDVYDVIRIGNENYEFVSGKKKHIAKIKSYFPNEHEAIDKYFELIDTSLKSNQNFFVEKVLPLWLSQLIGGRMRKKFMQFAEKTTYEVVSALTDNQRLITVLCGQCGDYGLPPKESSFAVHAMVVNHFIYGGYYPVGGADRIAHYISKKNESKGCKVLVNAGVDEVIIENGHATGVKIGEKIIKASNVISTAGIHNTFNKLLPTEWHAKFGYSPTDIQTSTGHLCLYLGLNKSDQELQLPRYNVWCYAHDDIDKVFDEIDYSNAGQKFAYLSFPSSKDREWQKRHPNKATIQALSLGKFEWFEAYQDQTVMKRDEDYRAMKASFEKNMLDKVFELYPQLKGNIEVMEVSTPLSTQTYANYAHGEIYGLAHNPKRFTLPYLRFNTPIKGFYLSGQDIVTCGVGGALMAGVLCAVSILGFKSRKLLKAFAEA
jgi:all-trans-retinol 13,14-reductase